MKTNDDTLMKVYGPNEAPPKMPEGQVEMNAYFVSKLTDPAQKAAAQSALDARDQDRFMLALYHWKA